MTRTGFVHQALCYGSDEEFLDGTLGYVRDGLQAGDAVLAVVAAANIGLLRDALGDAAREVEFVDSLGQHNDYCTAHDGGGTRQVRVIGEPVWTGRTDLETREWMRYESLLNIAFADSGHWILCPYDTRVLPEDVVATARRTHPELAVGTRVADQPPVRRPGRLLRRVRRNRTRADRDDRSGPSSPLRTRPVGRRPRCRRRVRPQPRGAREPHA
nr:MEDS domain-containing protein [Streptomyces regalis]